MEWCLHMLRKCDGGRSEWVMGNETLYTSITRTPSSGPPSGFSQSPPVKFKRSRSTTKQIITVYLAPGEEDKQRRVVHQHLPARGLRGLDCTSSTQRRPQPAAPPRQRKCPTPQTPLWTTWKQIEFSWSPRPRLFPGLASCAFFLFSQVKRHLKRK